MNRVVSAQENSPNVKEPGDSTIGHDMDSDFKARMESLEAAADQESYLRRGVKTMDDILGHLVSNSTVES